MELNTINNYLKTKMIIMMLLGNWRCLQGQMHRWDLLSLPWGCPALSLSLSMWLWPPHESVWLRAPPLRWFFPSWCLAWRISFWVLWVRDTEGERWWSGRWREEGSLGSGLAKRHVHWVANLSWICLSSQSTDVWERERKGGRDEGMKGEVVVDKRKMNE